MKVYPFKNFNYYVCEKCGSVYFGDSVCQLHERSCNGVFIPEVFTVYARLDTSSRGFVMGVTRHENGSETPVTGDAITAFANVENNGLLIYKDGSDINTVVIRSSPVILKDIPNALAAVEAEILRRLMELTKKLENVEEFVNRIAGNIWEIKNDSTPKEGN